MYRESKLSPPLREMRSPTLSAFVLPWTPGLAARPTFTRTSVVRTRAARAGTSAICMTAPRRTTSGVGELHESWGLYHHNECCVICYGRGTTRCMYCFGDGEVTIGAQRSRDTVTCPQCDALKYLPCERCGGSGERPLTRFDVDTQTEVPNATNADLCAPAPAPEAPVDDEDRVKLKV